MLPNLMIIGVPKAGTTSIFDYLSKHRNIDGSSKKETNYFVPIIYNEDVSDISVYRKFFSHINNNFGYVLEATPSYLYGGKPLFERIEHDLGNIRYLVVLRDPVRRIYSYYTHKIANLHFDSNYKFDDYINDCDITEKKLRSDSSKYYLWGLEGGMYFKYLNPLLEKNAENTKIIFFEDLVSNPRECIDGITNWLGVERFSEHELIFEKKNETVTYKNKLLHLLASNINKNMNFLDKVPRFKYLLKKTYKLVNYSTYTDQFEFNRKKLNEYYHIPNKKLAVLLKNHGYVLLPKWLK